MAKFQPVAKVECWVNMTKKDVKMVWHGDSTTIKMLLSQGYILHDKKDVLFKAIEVNDESVN